MTQAKRPNSRVNLDRAIDRICAESGANPVREKRLLAAVIVGQMLPDGAAKGANGLGAAVRPLVEPDGEFRAGKRGRALRQVARAVIGVLAVVLAEDHRHRVRLGDICLLYVRGGMRGFARLAVDGRQRA